MRHRVKKIKFKGGYDATRMLIKKLAYNFLTRGKIETTLSKAKMLKSQIERLVEKMKKKNEKNRQFFIKYFGKRHLLSLFFKTIGPVFANVNGGYVRIVNLGKRDSDGADIAKLEWTKPVVYQKKDDNKKAKKEVQTKKGK